MKKLLTIAGTALLGAALAGCTGAGEEETVELASLIDEGREQMVLEIGVDNTTMGNAIVEKFKADFEGSFVDLQFVEKGTAGLAEEIGQKQDEEVDIALVIGGEVIGREANFASLKDAVSSVKGQLHSDLEVIGGMGQVYAPAFFDGMAFGYNHSLMEAILGEGYAVNETSKLPEAFDTWEEIMEFATLAQAASTTSGVYGNGTWDGTTFTATSGDATFNEVFPVSTQEPWSGYALLTNAGFEIFGSDNGDDVGYASDELKSALDFLVSLRDSKVAYGTQSHLNGVDMGWRWEKLLAGETLFGQVGTWMDIDGKETENNLDIKLAYMPTYMGTQGAPFVKTKGFVVNKYIGQDKIEVAQAIINWLYSKDVMQTIVDNSSYLTTHDADAEITPNYSSDNALEMIYAMGINENEKTHKLSNNEAKAAMDIYYNEVNKTFMAYLWDGLDGEGNAYSSTDAQADLVAAQEAFLVENNS